MTKAIVIMIPIIEKNERLLSIRRILYLLHSFAENDEWKNHMEGIEKDLGDTGRSKCC